MHAFTHTHTHCWMDAYLYHVGRLKQDQGELRQLHVRCIQLLTSYVSADWIEESAAFSTLKICHSLKVVDSLSTQCFITIEINQYQNQNLNQNRFIRSYYRPRRPLLRPYLVAVEEATWIKSIHECMYV